MNSVVNIVQNEKYKRLFRFVIVGGLNTAIDFCIFYVLKNFFSVDYMLSQIGGYSAGVMNSFVMNKLWTFESKQISNRSIIELVRFITVNIASLGISLLGLKLLVDIMGLNMLPAKICVTLAAQFVNYTGYKIWVFAQK